MDGLADVPLPKDMTLLPENVLVPLELMFPEMMAEPEMVFVPEKMFPPLKVLVVPEELMFPEMMFDPDRVLVEDRIVPPEAVRIPVKVRVLAVAPAEATNAPATVSGSPEEPVWNSLRCTMSSRMALLMPEGAQPSAILMDSISVLSELVVEYSEILVLGMVYSNSP